MPGDGGLVDPVLVNEAVETEAFKVDNRRKLGFTEGLERHLFVYVTRMRHVVWVAAREEAPPSVGPTYPPKLRTYGWQPGPERGNGTQCGAHGAAFQSPTWGKSTLPRAKWEWFNRYEGRMDYIEAFFKS